MAVTAFMLHGLQDGEEQEAKKIRGYLVKRPHAEFTLRGQGSALQPQPGA